MPDSGSAPGRKCSVTFGTKTPVMDNLQYADEILRCWKINNAVDIILLKALPKVIWPMKIPGYQHKTIRMMGAHLHNCRCGWIKTVGAKWKVKSPRPVDNSQVTVAELIAALEG